MALPGLRFQDGLLRVVSPRSSAPSSPLRRHSLTTDQWIAALLARHMGPFTRSEFLKAVRALSTRYVQDRARLSSRSPLDTAGKRAAFAAFFAPLHFLTVRRILDNIAPSAVPARIVDLGCGTGVASAAWCATLQPAPQVVAVDQNAWALGETRWNCRQLALDCRVRRASMVDHLLGELSRAGSLEGLAFVCAWSLNELSADARKAMLDALLEAHRRGAQVLVVEPIALTAVPWWESWTAAAHAAAGRGDDWKFAPDLPAPLAELDEAAGFHRLHLSARSLWLGSGSNSRRG